MPEPENGNELRSDDVVELRIRWKQSTGQIDITGCVNVLPLALGLLATAERTVLANHAAAAASALERRITPANLLPRKM